MQARAAARLQYFKFTSDAFPPIVAAVKNLYKAYRAETKRLIDRNESAFDKARLKAMDQEDIDNPPLKLPKWARLNDMQKMSDSNIKRKTAHGGQEAQLIQKKRVK